MRRKNLKRHCKTIHGIDNEQYSRMRIKIYSCKYCKKPFARSINCLYIEFHCQPRKAGDLNYSDDFQFGAGTERDGGFEEIQRVFVIDRKQLAQNNEMNNLKSAMKEDAITSCKKK